MWSQQGFLASSYWSESRVHDCRVHTMTQSLKAGLLHYVLRSTSYLFKSDQEIAWTMNLTVMEVDIKDKIVN